MELFIRIVDGQPFEHPILGENFRRAFPDIDTNNLPPQFARFVRIPAPRINQLEVLEGPVYQWVDGVVQDVWTVREMNPTEREAKILLLTNFANEMHQDAISRVKASLAATTDPVLQQGWNDWLTALNAWVLVDPLNPNVPSAPEVIRQHLIASRNKGA